MHLISPLASGIVGAENGTFDVFARGTTTRVSIAYEFDGTGGFVPTGRTSLDSNGGKTVYVDSLVDVYVYDIQGNEVRRFCPGVSSGAVEVVSTGFTGRDYRTFAEGASEPTTLATALGTLETSFGDVDFNVDVNGSSMTVSEAVAGFAGIFYNVKSETYGAAGDGVTDDRVAIAAASSAALAAGGGTVYFPPGTYKIGSSIAFYRGVSIVGAGAGVSKISLAGTTTKMTFEDNNSTPATFHIAGLTFIANGATYALEIDKTKGGYCEVVGCEFEDGTTKWAGAIKQIAESYAEFDIRDCHFELDFASAKVLDLRSTVAKGWARISNCYFKLAAGTDGYYCIQGDRMTIDGCRFDVTALAAANNCILMLANDSKYDIDGMTINGATVDMGPCTSVIVAQYADGGSFTATASTDVVYSNVGENVSADTLNVNDINLTDDLTITSGGGIKFAASHGYEIRVPMSPVFTGNYWAYDSTGGTWKFTGDASQVATAIKFHYTFPWIGATVTLTQVRARVQAAIGGASLPSTLASLAVRILEGGETPTRIEAWNDGSGSVATYESSHWVGGDLDPTLLWDPRFEVLEITIAADELEHDSLSVWEIVISFTTSQPLAV